MFEHVLIEPDADLLFRLGDNEVCRSEPIGIDNRCRIRIIANVGLNFLCCFRIEARPVSSTALHPAAPLLR